MAQSVLSANSISISSLSRLCLFCFVVFVFATSWQLSRLPRPDVGTEKMLGSIPQRTSTLGIAHSFRPGPFVKHPRSRLKYSSGCDETECSLSARNVSAKAISATAGKTDELWWQANAELWNHVHSEEEFSRAVQDDAFKLVLVDWFAPWCNGCRRAYPELCRIAALDKYRSDIKFVKVSVDELRALSRKEGVKALPQVGLYRPGHGFLMSFQAVPSQMRIARSNIDIMLENPKKYFKLDPNHHVVVLDEDPAPERSAAKQAAAELSKSSGGLFERLMASANGLDVNGSASNRGNGNGNGTPPSAPSAVLKGATPAQMGLRVGDALTGSDARMAAAKQKFLARWNMLYGYNGRIDKLYQDEIACRMQPNEHYLDYTGSSLYCKSQLSAAFEELQANIFGNPHSANPSSVRTEEKVEAVREMVLKFFNADPSEYQLAFVKSATGALKITGETFPWSDGSVFRYTRENHNSVLGIREYALQHGSKFQAVEEEWVEEWISGKKEDQHFLHPKPGAPGDPVYSLFAFPAEENFAGAKYPLRWIREIQGMSTPEHKWKVLVDAAAYVPTQPLDLAATPADFVSISFYKMFGFPTGLGGLLVRTENVELMRKVFWGGGTVSLATAGHDFHVLKCRPSDKLEDGTVAFLDIINLRHGFNYLKMLGGIERVQDHVYALTRYFYERMTDMRHKNGAPLTRVFGKHNHRSPRDVQGAIVNFEVLDMKGTPVSYRTVETDAAEAGFHIRTGTECNPGAAYRSLGIEEEEVESLAGVKEGCDDDVDFIDVKRAADNGTGIVTEKDVMSNIQGTKLSLGHPAEVGMKWVKAPLGSMRASLGYMSTFEDVEALCQFLEDRYTDTVLPELQVEL